MKEVIIYPNNTASVDGKFLDCRATVELLKKFDISDVRVDADIRMKINGTRFVMFASHVILKVEWLEGRIQEVAGNLRTTRNQVAKLTKQVESMKTGKHEKCLDSTN